MPRAASNRVPLKPITTGQLRALHAIARRRGWSHDELHDIAGVESLKLLSVTEAARLIERVQTRDHEREFTPGEPDRARGRNVIRSASERQRNYMSHLFDELGWDVEKADAWLRERHGIRDLAGGVFTARTASEAVYQLEQALAKERAKQRVQPPLDGGLNVS